MIKASSDGIALTEQLRQTQRPLFLFTGLWVVSTAILTFGPKYWSYQFGLTVFAILLNLVAGATMLIAYLRHIKTMDELQRQTHLEAMSLTLGITMIITVVYGALSKIGILSSAHPTNILVFMSATYLCTVVTLWVKRTRE